MKVTIVSREKFKRDFLPFVNDNEDTFYLSILEPDEPTPLREEKTNYKTFCFYDLEEDLDNGKGFLYKAISQKQAEEIFNYIKSHSDKNNFVVSCAAGVSRSGAVGSFVHEYFGGAYKDLLKTHPHILPNGRVTRLLRMYERMDGEDSTNYIF